MDFAPADDMQCLLLRYLRHRHAHVSYERIVSGPGLLAIFEFMRDTGLAIPSAQLLKAMEREDAAAVLTKFAQAGDEAIARMTVDLFLSVYGAFVGNLALAALPRGGIYIAGGIAAKISAKMQAGEFMNAFLAKGRFDGLLATLPLHMVLNPDVGLLGANLTAQRHGQLFA
jgi:glucokinase